MKNDTDLFRKCLSLMEEYHSLECYPLRCQEEVEMTRIIELVRERVDYGPLSENSYSSSSISEFERNKPVKTMKSLNNLIRDIQEKRVVNKDDILNHLKEIKNLLKNGD